MKGGGENRGEHRGENRGKCHGKWGCVGDGVDSRSGVGWYDKGEEARGLVNKPMSLFWRRSKVYWR